jgi:Glucose / Sorbosone dehydrogenase
MRRLIGCLAVAALLACGTASEAAAVTLTPIDTFERPIFVSSDPADPNRLLVVEREGRVIEVTATGSRLFADFVPLVSCCASERGLLSIAPAPDFASSGLFYAAYTGRPAAGGQEGDVHVDAFRPGPEGAGQVVREPIISIGHAQEANHNGGQIQLGPDGYLYVSTGDGGGGGDPFESGQDAEALLGKILRIDPRPGQEPPYAIPAGNPFVGLPGRDEIWALGLRNPWRFSFDRLSGDMVIADVGQDAREEVDFAPSSGAGAVSGAGVNYGWNCREGTIAYPEPALACASASGFVDPVFDYPHQDPGDGSAHGCSIIGGYVVRDASLGDLYGRYVYTDFCTAEVRSQQLPALAGGIVTGDRSEDLKIDEPTSFGEDSCGRLYVVSDGGAVYRLAGRSPAGCGQLGPPAPTPTPIATPKAKSVQKPKRAHKPKPGHGPKHLRQRLRLSALRMGGGSALRFRFVARLAPCGDAPGRDVHLRRNGHRVRAGTLDRRCVARFRLLVRHRASFRAVLPLGPRGSLLRSPRLVIDPR